MELPSEISGEIDPPGDEDWFRFEAPRAGTLAIRGRVTSGDLILGLVLGSRSLWAGDFDVDWELSLDAGTHYLEVQHNDSPYDGGTGDYTLELLFEEVADDHGDDRASATPVELPSETAGEIGAHDDADWFRFEVAADGWVTIESVYGGDGTSTLIVGTLYDAERNALAQKGANLSASRNPNQILRRLDAGIYFVRVAPTGFYDCCGGSTYVIRLAHLPTGTAPTVTDVTIASAPWDGTYEVGEEISVEATFDSVLEVSGRPRLALTIGSRTRQANYRPPRSGETVSGRSIWFVYAVQPSDRDFDGISIGANALQLNGGTIRDAGGTTNARLSLGSRKISNAAGHAVDGRRETVPTVSRVSWGSSPQGGTYEVGQAIVARVVFDRPVVVTGQPSLALTIGETVRQAGMPSQSRRSSVLTFRYVVQPSDRDADGIGIGAGALTLNGGTIRRSGGNASASLGLGDHAVSNMADRKVDGSRETAPALAAPVWMPFPLLGDTFEVGEVILGSAIYDRYVEVAGEPRLELRIGPATRQARFFSQLGRRVYFQYVVQPSDADVDGIGIDSPALKLNGGTIRTRGGTANAALDFDLQTLSSWSQTTNSYFLPDVDGAFHKVDGGRGRAAKATGTSIVSIPAVGGYGAGDEITARVSFDKAVEVAGVPQLALTIGTATRRASYVEHLEDGDVARHARWLYFRYVVQPSDRDDDGIGIGALSLNGGTITTQGSGTNAELEIGAAAIANDWLHKVNAGDTAADDHGDDLSSATRVALPSETAGEIDPGTDVDWFRFEVSASSEVTAETTGRLDAVGTLYDVGGNVLGEDDDSGAGLNFRIRRVLDAGTYFVRVAPFGSATGGYVLRLSAEAGSSGAAATFRDCAECPLMVRIPAGAFTMGAPESETGSFDHERPQRTVSIPDFAAGAHEVTFAQWDACVADGGCGGYSPDDEGWGRDNRPVFGVSWDDAQLYVDWLSQSTGQRYRLLTESEWEYAARAGATTPFHTGSTITPQQANFDGRYDYPGQEYDESGLFRGQTLPVGSFAPNGFGLYDMHGNMWEWVQDCYGGYAAAASDGSAVGGDCIDRVLRGGSWLDEPSYIRAANRTGQASRAGGADDPDFYGFRVARTL